MRAVANAAANAVKQALNASRDAAVRPKGWRLAPRPERNVRAYRDMPEAQADEQASGRLSGHAGCRLRPQAGTALSSGPKGQHRYRCPAGGVPVPGAPAVAGARVSADRMRRAQGNKALRTKVNGELVIGEVDAVVPVIGDDQPDITPTVSPSAVLNAAIGGPA